jgi:alkylation response protein AidB-like acyl-CoA dehydrogenase
MSATVEREDTDKQTRLVALAAELADDFATRAAEHDRDNSFPFENFQKMRETRYLGLTIPERLGGLGASILDFALCQERLARGDGATAVAVNMHLFGLGALLEGGPTEPNPTRDMLLQNVASGGLLLGGSLTEPESGGNWGFPITRAEPVPGGYTLSGRKIFASMAPAMDIFLVSVTVPGENGGPDEVGTLAIPRGTPGLEIIETWDALGMRATASHDLKFTNVMVPQMMLIERRAPGNFDAAGVAVFAWFSTSIASVYTGVATAARNFAVEYAKNRRPSVLERPISHLPAVQFAVADMDIMLATSRALTRQICDEWLRGEHHDVSGMARVMQAKYYATPTAIDVVNKAMGVVGGLGLYKKTPLERYYRDVRAGTFHPINQDVTREWIGKAAFGIDPAALPRWA